MTSAALLIAAALMTGCAREAAEAEIKIPILGADSAGGSFTTAAAERFDVEEFTTVGAEVDYIYSEKLSVPYDTNVLEYNVKKGDRLSEGDVIAVFDSSEFDYELRNQQIITDSAYNRWKSSGSELARLEYEQEAKRLELIQYRIGLCTVRAPYDCVIWSAEKLKAGETVTAGQAVCTVAKPDEVYVTVKDSKELFAFGMPVKLKFGTSGTFTGKVVMVPEKGLKSGLDRVVIALDDGELERANEEAGSIASAGWGSVIVTSYRDYNVLCVPEKAVLQYSGETYCYIDENGERVRVPVEAGKTVDSYTVILSGLSDGDIVSY
ncbi:MAG: HlyD family efflux transporter periplasmic adaptor subunit, partial [Ruminiclostridium sp.]|nr:HlyD family efflux transporter periplasmic adaptor subunit [Ruminiclostridium sp.]